MKTEGDAFMAAFSAPLDAACCAADIQLALHDAPWPAWLVGLGAAAAAPAPKKSSFFGSSSSKKSAPVGGGNEAMEPSIAALSEEVGFALVDEPHGFRGLRMRIGLHQGPVTAHDDPTTGRVDYFGPTVGDIPHKKKAHTPCNL